MRNHQQCPPEDAMIAKLGDATFVRLDTTDCPWNEKDDHEWQNTTKLIRYGATFWKKIVPEPGYRLVEDHERVGLMPEKFKYMQSDRIWRLGIGRGDGWIDDCTYAVPIKQVVAVPFTFRREREVIWIVDQFGKDIAQFDEEGNSSKNWQDAVAFILNYRAVERANRGEL